MAKTFYRNVYWSNWQCYVGKKSVRLSVVSWFLGLSHRRTRTVPAGKTLLTPEGSLTAVMKSLYSVKLSSD